MDHIYVCSPPGSRHVDPVLSCTSRLIPRPAARAGGRGLRPVPLLPATGRGPPRHDGTGHALMAGRRGMVPMPDAQTAGRVSVGRLAPVAVIVVVAAIVIAMGWHRQLSFDTLVRHRVWLADFVSQHCAAALACFMAIYVAAVSLSLPGAAFLTIAGGLL